MGDFLKKYWWLFLVVGLGIALAFMAMGPAPPKSFTFASGSADGTYIRVAESYRDALAEEDVDVTVLETAGSMDNLALLRSGEADVALIQGGMPPVETGEDLVSLGGVFYEPVFVFVREGVEAERFSDLAALRLAIGPEGSGSHQLASVLIGQWQVAWPEPAKLSLSGDAAARALLAGEIDAALFVASIETDYVRQLLLSDEVRLLRFETAEAHARRMPYLGALVLLQGVIDFDRNLPASDTPLIAPAAQLVARADLHPAIQSLLVETAHDIHRGNSVLAPAGTFPNRDLVDLPLSKQAERYFENGPTFLRRFFSFSVANFLDRAWVLLIPLLTLAYPLFRAAPPIYRWRTRRKIYVWYQDLRSLESKGRAARTAPERELVRDHLRQLQAETGRVEVPLSYTDDLYRLRNHIAFVNQLLGNLDPRQTIDPPGADDQSQPASLTEAR